MTAGPSDLAQTDATGTVRRLQALAAAGWPVLHIAAELGMFPTAVSRLMRMKVITLRTARRVAAGYDRLWNVDPATRGATPERIARTKARAAELGWAPAGAWDEESIDVPSARPEWTGHCGTARGVTAHEEHGIPLCPPCQAAADRRRLRNQARERRALTATRA